MPGTDDKSIGNGPGDILINPEGNDFDVIMGEFGGQPKRSYCILTAYVAPDSIILGIRFASAERDLTPVSGLGCRRLPATT